jgi:hypothetical protein
MRQLPHTLSDSTETEFSPCIASGDVITGKQSLLRTESRDILQVSM